MSLYLPILVRFAVVALAFCVLLWWNLRRWLSQKLRITSAVLMVFVFGGSVVWFAWYGAHKAPLYQHLVDEEYEVVDWVLMLNPAALRDDDGDAMIDRAVAEGRIPLVEFLISKGETIDHGVVVESLRNSRRDDERNCIDDVRAGETHLHQAALSGNLALVELLLEHGGDPRSANADGLTALHQACRGGRLEVARTLLNAGADPNAMTTGPLVCTRVGSADGEYHKRAFPQSPLVMAASATCEHETDSAARRADERETCSLDLIKLLVQRGARLDGETGAGVAALETAVARESSAKVRLLIELGVDVSQLDPGVVKGKLIELVTGHRILGSSCDRHGCGRRAAIPVSKTERSTLKGIIGSLIESGLEPEGRELHFAAWQGHEQEIRRLVSGGARLDQKCDAGFLPLHYAALGGQAQILPLLLDYENEPNFQPRLIEFFAENGDVEVMAAFLDAKPELILSAMDELPLTIAAGRGHLEMVRFLVDRGVPVDPVSEQSSSPLSHAAESGDVEIVSLLLERGAKPNHGSDNPLRNAIAGEHLAIVDALLAAGADPNWGKGRGLAEAAELDNLPIIRSLLKAGVDASIGEGFALKRAIQANNKEMMELLVASGADVNAGSPTPMNAAAASGNTEAVAFLLSNGADINAAQLYASWLPLFEAIERSDARMVAFLLDHGARLSVVHDDDRQTPLHKAAIKGDLEIVKLLVERGHPLDAKDAKGRTAEQVVVDEHYQSEAIRDYLRSR